VHTTPTVIDLRPDWVSEVRGFNAETCTRETAARLLRILFARLVLVIRRQDLSCGQLVGLADLFGTPELPWDRHNCDPTEPMVQVFRSEGQRSYRRPTEFWHTDGSFLGRRTMATLLHVVENPEVGGDTLFANMQAAWGALPDDVQQRAAASFGIHSYQYQFRALRQQSGKDMLAATEPASFPDVTHPLVCRHPITGVPALYLNELCLAGVVGAGSDRSMIERLLSHATQASFVYRHVWEPGDVLVWDNRSVMHRATPIGPGCVREVHRITSLYADETAACQSPELA